MNTVMGALNTFLDICRVVMRSGMRWQAKALNHISGGRISPNMVTLASLLGHVLIAYLIAARHPLWAALLLIIFGLFDALDGELARLQKRASAAGMLLDATTDRVKEVLLYTGCAYFFITLGYPYFAVWAVTAVGSSLLVSYVKAKGETAVVGSGLPPNEINRLFQDGLARFEVRMALLIIGLVTSLLAEMFVLITVLASLTILQRLIKISRSLQSAQN